MVELLSKLGGGIRQVFVSIVYRCDSRTETNNRIRIVYVFHVLCVVQVTISTLVFMSVNMIQSGV